jgi:hypothetical protein
MFQRKIQLSTTEWLTIRWQKDWVSLTVKLNTRQIGSFSSKTDLETGKWLQLPEGRTLLVRLVKNELEIWDGNNELVSGLKSGATDYFPIAWKALMGYGIFFLAAIALASIFKDWVIPLPVLIVSLIIGFGNLSLALWARAKKDTLPLKIGLVLNCLLFITSLLTGGFMPAAFIGVVVYYIYKGIVSGPIMTSDVEYIAHGDVLDADI